MNELANCIHCGLCLEACPTYRVSGNEAESPRGRLRLMAELASGTELDYAPLDRCLGCRGCESVCPSGVPYGEHLERARERRPAERRWRWLVDRVLSDPSALRAAARAGVVARALGGAHWLPKQLRPALSLLPRQLSPTAHGLPSQGSVAILAGCAQGVLQPELLVAVAKLVRACGESPFVAAEAACCGALSAHQGSAQASRARAAKLLAAMNGVSTLLIPSAGCSAHLANYGKLMADTEFAPAALALQERSQDALLWLAARAEKLQFRRSEGSIAYHPPCHHTHAQGLRGAAETLLLRVPGLKLAPIQEPERCCGSAGSYSLEQPELAAAIRLAKWADLRASGAPQVLSANPGCELFLAAGRGAYDPEIGNLYAFLAARLGSAPGNG